MMPYDDFKAKVAKVLAGAEQPLTWTEVRTEAGLPQRFPNNQWVRRLEADISLDRQRDAHGIIHWQIKEGTADAPTSTTPEKLGSKTRRK